MRLSTIPEAVAADANLCGFIDYLCGLLEKGGGIVTDVGYCFAENYAELAIAAPDGTRLNVKVSRL